jgi:hypothetical protein
MVLALMAGRAHVAHQAAGSDAVDFPKFAGGMCLVAEARQLRRLAQFRTRTNQFPRPRDAHLSQISLRRNPCDPVEDPDEMTLVKSWRARPCGSETYTFHRSADRPLEPPSRRLRRSHRAQTRNFA